jgi:hypothetical protein
VHNRAIVAQLIKKCRLQATILIVGVVSKSGLESTPAVTATRGMAWIAEGKIYAVPLPKS